MTTAMRRIVSTGNLALSQSLEKELMSFYFWILLFFYSFENIHIKVTPFIACIICFIFGIFAVGKEILPYVACLLKKGMECFLIIPFASVEGRRRFARWLRNWNRHFFSSRDKLVSWVVVVLQDVSCQYSMTSLYRVKICWYTECFQSISWMFLVNSCWSTDCPVSTCWSTGCFGSDSYINVQVTDTWQLSI